jgi:hypothetical protein
VNGKFLPDAYRVLLLNQRSIEYTMRNSNEGRAQHVKMKALQESEGVQTNGCTYDYYMAGTI